MDTDDLTANDAELCTLFDNDQNKCDIIVGTKRAVASLSMIGCLFIIILIWLFKKYLFFTQRLILYLSCTAFIDAMAYLLGGIHEDGAWCEFQAWMLSFFDWAVLLWVCCITFNLYYNVIKMKSSERFEILYHVICWGFPLFISLLPFIGDHYGPAGAWCWINDGDNYWRFFTWYGPLFVIIIIMFAVYSYITYRLNQRVRNWEGTYNPDAEHSRQLLKEDIKPLKAYPFIYLVLSIFPLINRIQNAVNPDNSVFALVLLHAICSPLQGVFNAIAYGLDRETISRMTWSQISNAFKSKFSGHAVIGEYAIDNPVQDTIDETNDETTEETQSEMVQKP